MNFYNVNKFNNKKRNNKLFSKKNIIYDLFFIIPLISSNIDFFFHKYKKIYHFSYLNLKFFISYLKNCSYRNIKVHLNLSISNNIKKKHIITLFCYKISKIFNYLDLINVITKNFRYILFKNFSNHIIYSYKMIFNKLLIRISTFNYNFFYSKFHFSAKYLIVYSDMSSYEILRKILLNSSKKFILISKFNSRKRNISNLKSFNSFKEKIMVIDKIILIKIFNKIDFREISNIILFNKGEKSFFI
ncbi:hypothetical protein (nucleomorph) [Guillardia theta]|uniref:Uncharacterized protein n=1 Tax=Guillardia theta TaxID=55529 RepID=Q98RR0_GUITH|nr:hypothetical protein GTHECHR1094 [Guillardia theta]AAK39887.1 hypothetical protein [Guillardia theta]